MADQKISRAKAPKADDGLAATVRWQGKAIQVILGVLASVAGKKVVKQVEAKLGVDLDGDGKAGNARVFALFALSVLLFVGVAHGKNLFTLHNADAKHGTFKVLSDDAGTATLTVDAVAATVTATGGYSGTYTNAGLGGATNVVVVSGGIVTSVTITP